MEIGCYTPMPIEKIIDLMHASMTPSYVSKFYDASRNTVKTIVRRSKLSTYGMEFLKRIS